CNADHTFARLTGRPDAAGASAGIRLQSTLRERWKIMADAAEQRLKAHLEQFVLPETGRPLGTRGSRFELGRADGRLRLAVHVGFPIERSRDTLAQALTEHCREAIDEPVAVEIDWA